MIESKHAPGNWCHQHTLSRYISGSYANLQLDKMAFVVTTVESG